MKYIPCSVLSQPKALAEGKGKTAEGETNKTFYYELTEKGFSILVVEGLITPRAFPLVFAFTSLVLSEFPINPDKDAMLCGPAALHEMQWQALK